MSETPDDAVLQDFIYFLPRSSHPRELWALLYENARIFPNHIFENYKQTILKIKKIFPNFFQVMEFEEI